MAVYRIVGPLGEAGIVYYGSTRNIEHRLSEHKSAYRSGVRCPSSKRLFDEYGVDACRMEVVEEVKEDMIERERWWIENHECVNKAVPGRTHAEYLRASRGKRLAQMVVYQQANREKLRAQAVAYRTVNKDEIRAQKAEYQQANREKLRAKQAEYYQANREKLRAKQAERRAAKKVSQ